MHLVGHHHHHHVGGDHHHHVGVDRDHHHHVSGDEDDEQEKYEAPTSTLVAYSSSFSLGFLTYCGKKYISIVVINDILIYTLMPSKQYG